MWWITLIIAAVLFVAFSVFLKLSYTKNTRRNDMEVMLCGG